MLSTVFEWSSRHEETVTDVPADTVTHTADEFAAFFSDKVEAVRTSTTVTPLYDVPYRLTPTLAEWSIVTSEEIEKLISAALNKTCQLDPAPTWLSPFISLLFSKSFTTDCLLQEFKEAVKLLFDNT